MKQKKMGTKKDTCYEQIGLRASLNSSRLCVINIAGRACTETESALWTLMSFASQL